MEAKETVMQMARKVKDEVSGKGENGSKLKIGSGDSSVPKGKQEISLLSKSLRKSRISHLNTCLISVS